MRGVQELSDLVGGEHEHGPSLQQPAGTEKRAKSQCLSAKCADNNRVDQRFLSCGSRLVLNFFFYFFFLQKKNKIILDSYLLSYNYNLNIVIWDID